MQLLTSGHFNQFEYKIFDSIIHSLTSPNDPWMTIADFRSYVNAQKKVAEAYRDQNKWTRMSILNTACSGKFSSDRTIEEYNNEIWKCLRCQYNSTLKNLKLFLYRAYCTYSL
ncbi:glycogen/starch/alpha-glucan phosphorylase [Candidatus Kuenenia stuttgartiensis]|uniref:glycogen/starch/alpha-glucan phosphorylase n=1 Tax=Kuenenia stuttgartiensis TaxID=174633 RepID=UPI0021BCD9A0|nr:glycogen/starch/alpha-glucan phosphorylase [Candidatus Kuenenia stuttgartiensis]